ncbi:unannotated protein [freshwater metagenome]|uniref:Unannotated protein n=1 Tax=freshwater metagenome TaxID=449393 RepID=A0A6J7RSY4_9ZZZZ
MVCCSRHRPNAELQRVAKCLRWRWRLCELQQRQHLSCTIQHCCRCKIGNEYLAHTTRLRRSSYYLQTARLALCSPALLGRTLPHCFRCRWQPTCSARPTASGFIARTCRLQTARSRPERCSNRTHSATCSYTRVGRCGTRPWRRSADLPPRSERDASVGRFMLVRTALPRPHQHRIIRQQRS